MPQVNFAGPGQGLPPPQSLYPSSLLLGAPGPYVPGTNEVALAAGDVLPIPAGQWIVQVGPYSVLQWLDPVTGIWRGFASALTRINVVQSDGFTRRVANLTGCPVAAVVTTQGSGYVQATTTVTSNAGGSTWQPIVGGLLTLTTISVAGASYSIPPICIIPAGPAPTSAGVPQSVQATAVAALSSGTVSTITVTNQGAGYPAGLTVTLLPDPTDPNIASITNAVAIFGTTGAGAIAAVLCTNNGTPGTTLTTLTVAGAGTLGAATAVEMFTILTATMAANGAGYGPSGFTTYGGFTAATATHTNPSVELNTYIPRPAQGTGTAGGSLGTLTTISLYDSGLFTGTPTGVAVGGAVTTTASIVLGLGGKPDSVLMQPC